MAKNAYKEVRIAKTNKTIGEVLSMAKKPKLAKNDQNRPQGWARGKLLVLASEVSWRIK